MKNVQFIALLLVSLFLLVAGAAAETIKVQNVQVNSIGATIPVNIILDTSTEGIAGYDITISLNNSTVATITSVSFPSWALLNESTTLPSSSVRLRMLDLYEKVNASDTDVPFGTITLQGNAVGMTNVVVTIKNITSDDGDRGSTNTEPIIADHTTTQLSQVPLTAINNAKTNMHIAYGHTSHGSQITSGMTGLTTFSNAPYGGSTYLWNNGGTDGALDLRDTPFSGASDLGNPSYTAWATSTRTYLNANTDVNVVMWSWCGQADTTEANINTYLSQMNQLEKDYPNVQFVYMTGHLVGTGTNGNLNQRNEQIRAFVRSNNKILYDFADIESYDPDGVYYGDKLPSDGCNYDYNNNGVTSQSGDPALPTNGDRNWAIDWQSSHTQGTDWYNCGAAHTQPLNANQKAYAAWWLWARLGGWDGSTGTVAPVADFTANITSGNGPLTVQFTDASIGTPTSWNWSFGDGSLSTSQNPLYTYTGSGSHTLSLNATNSAGSNIMMKTGFITVTSSGVTSKFGVFRNGLWYMDHNGNMQWDATDGNMIKSFGLPGDSHPVVGDWTGDGKDEFGVFRDGLWYMDYNGNMQWDATDGNMIKSFGLPGDSHPVVGDWTGDGKDEFGVFRNGLWYMDYNGNMQWDATDASMIKSFGLPGDTYPVAGDWTGDGKDEFGVFRNGLWYMDYNGNMQWDATDASMIKSFGLPGDTYPVAGDWTGDGKDEFGVFRDGLWYMDYNRNMQWDATDASMVKSFGLPGDSHPVVGKW